MHFFKFSPGQKVPEIMRLGLLSKEVKSALKEEEVRQRALPVFPNDYISTEYRRAARLTRYSVIKASALCLPLLRTVSFFRLQMPFNQLPVVPSEGKTPIHF